MPLPLALEMKLCGILLLCSFFVYSQQDAASDMAGLVTSLASNFFNTDQLTALGNAIASQICGGSTIPQVFENFLPTVTNTIDGGTAFQAMQVFGQLSGDLGDDVGPVLDAVAATAQAYLTDPLNAVLPACPNGNDAAIQAAIPFITEDFVRNLFQQLRDATVAVKPQDWDIVKQDLGASIYFDKYGV